MPLPLTIALFLLLAALDLLTTLLSFARSITSEGYYAASTIVLYLVGMLTWVAASRAWIRHPRSLGIQLSYLLSLGLMNACAVGATYRLAEGGWASLLVPWVQFLTSAFLPALFLHYVLITPAPLPKLPRAVRFLLYLPAGILLTAWTWGYLHGRPYQRSFLLIALPPYRSAAIGYTLGYLLIGQAVLLYNCFKAPTRAQRRQSKWLLIGIAGGLLPVTCLVSIPQIFGSQPPLGLAPAYTLILIPVCYVVAIIRHRLMDLELMLNRSAVYAIVSSLTIGAYLLGIQIFSRAFRFLLGSSEMVVAGLSALLVAVLFAPIKARVQDGIDRAFYREQYNYRQTLLRLSRTLSSILALDSLADTLLTEVTSAMHIRSGALLVREETGFHVQAIRGEDGRSTPQRIPLQDPWFQYVQSVQTPTRTRALPKAEITAAMQELCAFLNPEVWVPFLLRDHLNGVLVLGPKISGEPYTYEDLSLLGTLMHQGGVAIQNALLYQELRLRTEALERARDQLMQAYVDTYGGTLPQTPREDVVADFQAIATALKQSYQRLKELDALKTQFVSNVSHELGTPLTHIKGYVDNLLQGIGGPLTEKQRRYLNRIADNCDRLIRLINDLLDLSRIESGRVTLHLKEVDVVALVDEVLLNLQDKARAGRIALRSGHASPDLRLWADPDKLRQILLNLLENALKFTDPGGKVEVRTEILPSEWVAIHVEDTGIGIAPEEQTRIFERFHQVPGTKTRGTHGTGLGLAIVKSLVELHEGEIQVESEPGRGSCFSVLLPKRNFPNRKGGGHVQRKHPDRG